MALYLIPNHAMPTTAAPTAVATGTAIKTMLQVKPSATIIAKIIEWGFSFDGNTPGTPGKVELIETDVAATVTAHVAAGLTKYDAAALIGGDPSTNLIQVGTSATGYTATAEGSITAARVLDEAMFVQPTTQPFVKQFPLGREPVIQIGLFGRIRMTFGTTVNALCYMIVEV